MDNFLPLQTFTGFLKNGAIPFPETDRANHTSIPNRIVDFVGDLHRQRLRFLAENMESLLLGFI